MTDGLVTTIPRVLLIEGGVNHTPSTALINVSWFSVGTGGKAAGRFSQEIKHFNTG